MRFEEERSILARGLLGQSKGRVAEQREVRGEYFDSPLLGCAKAAWVWPGPEESDGARIGAPQLELVPMCQKPYVLAMLR